MAEKRTSKRLARPAAKRRAKKTSAPKAEPLNGEEPLAEASAAEAEAAPKRRKRKAPVEEQPAPETESVEEELDPTLREQLMQEIDSLIKRLRAIAPGYNPPPFSPTKLMGLVQENLDKLPPEMGLGILSKLRKAIGEDLFDVDTWKGMWYMLNYTLEYQGDVVKRRVTGEYETDEWGLDREVLDAVRPFFEFMYKKYWRVSLSGVENVPEEGRALLVANHSGQLPWDGSMLASGIMLEHPNQRLVRTLYATWFPTLPILSDIFVKCGQVLATDDNGTRLLENEELVAVYPEGYKGVGKLYKDRYNLARFGRGGFVRMALKTRAPIIPVAIVGAEETYISLAKSNVMAKLIGFPYFPISPTFPWLGLLGFIPLPTKWYIDIGEPIPTEGYKPNAESNVMLVSQLTDQVRNVVQKMIYDRLEQRRSVFFG